MNKIVIKAERCKACSLCVQECPKGVLKLGTESNAKGYNYVVADQEKCISCGICALFCPDMAISVYKEEA